ncbi:MAG: hypothetical protein V4692_06110 [Bdellovibrionota bacterium]
MQILKIFGLLVATLVVSIIAFRILASWKVGTEETDSGEISLPLLTTTAYEWITTTKICQFSTGEKQPYILVYFALNELSPLYEMRESFKDSDVKAKLRISYRKNIFGYKVVSKFEVISPGFFYTPK